MYFSSGSQNNLHMENHNGHGYAKKLNNSMVKKNLVSTSEYNAIQSIRCFFFHILVVVRLSIARNHDLLSSLS